MKKLLAAVFALACVLTLARAAHADQNTLFGVGDDLTVNGTDGTYADADVEIYGLTVLGPKPGSPIRLEKGSGYNQGSLYVGKDLEVSSIAYLPPLGNIIPSDLSGNGNKVVRVNSGGTALEYGSVGSMLDTGVGLNTVPYWTGTTYAGSAISQNAGLVTISSNTQLSANLHVRGTLDVDSYSTFGASVTANSTLYVSSATQLGATGATSGTNGGVGINTAPVTDTALTVLGSGTTQKYIATFYSGDGTKLAAWIQNK